MDDDGKKPEAEPPEPARDAAQDEGAKLREVSDLPGDAPVRLVLTQAV